MNLYDEYAQEFSKTRQSPWLGWLEVLKYIKTLKEPLKILDLGCGNGRFLKFIADQDLKIDSYVGVDNSNLLLKETENKIYDFETRDKIESGCELKLDLNSEDWQKKIVGEFNLVVSFGLIHHIKTFEGRKNFLENSFALTQADGLLAISYWQFGKLKRYDQKKIHTDENKDSKYSENDFILNFGTSKAKRFCHFVNENELKELEENLDFKDSKTFVNDGKENNENLYRLYFK